MMKYIRMLPGSLCLLGVLGLFAYGVDENVQETGRLQEPEASQSQSMPYTNGAEAARLEECVSVLNIVYRGIAEKTRNANPSPGETITIPEHEAAFFIYPPQNVAKSEASDKIYEMSKRISADLGCLFGDSVYDLPESKFIDNRQPIFK